LAKVLYITYDGLTDPIGQSQILPYLLGCARAGHELTVISFEKSDRHARAGTSVQATMDQAGIGWLPQRFHREPRYLAKVIDMIAMDRAAATAVRKQPFDLIHARSYQAAVTALKLKVRYGAKLLFDMRGFWPDQRREGGRWRRGSPLGDYLYRRWKGHEAALIERADHIISLTEAARQELTGWSCYRGAPVSVIPCCVDFDLFGVASHPQRMAARERLQIADDVPVLGYLGSVGTVYRMPPHFGLFGKLREAVGAKLLFVSGEPESIIVAEAAKAGIPLQPDDIRVVRAERPDVPLLLGAMDAATCFITPTFSSLGVSPTKLGEYWASGIPVYANDGIGDATELLHDVGGGHVLPDFSEASIERAAQEFPNMLKTDGMALREKARQRLDLELAIRAYSQIYADLRQPRSLVA
jgi:glycosyltransferase involved in cell wall biosynthesis